MSSFDILKGLAANTKKKPAFDEDDGSSDPNILNDFQDYDDDGDGKGGKGNANSNQEIERMNQIVSNGIALNISSFSDVYFSHLLETGKLFLGLLQRGLQDDQ